MDQKSNIPLHGGKLLNAHILYKKSGERKPLLKLERDCISALLAASLTDPMAPDASDRFSSRHFLS